MDLTGAWDYIEQVASRRRVNNQTPRHIANENLEVIGAAGELVARRFLGLPEELHENFDGGVDLVWRGLRIDVKATRLTPHMKYRYLQWPVGKRIKADIILLVGIDLRLRQAAPIGYALAAEINGAEINSTRQLPCKEIPILRLHEAWELLTLQSPQGDS